jgi:hypothetical protein
MNSSDEADDGEGQVLSRVPMLQPTLFLIASLQEQGDDDTQSSNGPRLLPSSDTLCLP